MKNDNICAIATPYGVGAISIIRASGPDSITLVNKVFKGKNLNECLSHTINYGHIVDKDTIIDEVMVSIFLAPRSFDGENMAEINCHGGVFCTNKVLETLLNVGFRLALPGEFSKRAFLNKKMDLTQTEAIMDIVAADNMNALISGENSLRSQIRNMIDKKRNALLSMMAEIEVNIDYPEYDDAVVVTNEMLIPNLKSLSDEMAETLENSKVGKVAIHGINVAIVGKPNVGKSSILNMLLDEDRAIVSDIEGTTRDIIEEKLSLGDVTINLIDTAGIRDSSDKIEKIGIERSLKAIEKADLILLVIDQSRDLDIDDYTLLEKTSLKPRIIISNKKDLPSKMKLNEESISMSALKKEGLKSLLDKIKEVMKINEFNVKSPNYLSNVRHIDLMKKAMSAINSALKSAEDRMEVDLIEIDIKEAFDILGEITGEAYDDELIDSLFSKFCLGK